MKFPYTEKVLEHFRNPKNVGKLEDADGKGLEGSPACGDMVAVYLKVDPKTTVIDDIKFESYGCASNIATASIITEMAKGKTIADAKKITWQEATDELGGLPPVKRHCSVLAVEGLRSAIRDYEEKHGLVSEQEPTTEEVVRSRLKHVMNPMAGLDIVRTELVTKIEVKEGIVRVVLDLPSNHQFANAIKEDLVEKLEALWDVKEVKVVFTEG
ncbi:iron-sulfur cluster biosynthesis protein, NifU-like protein [Methanomethylovorans hollandica DSM 15978]|jgi:NifU-like protein involved in Fe-S cluster formation/metal-sulfur cluster biosynthetic enzyme|uniref:Iron-sulfur cluster biosynthesis protein, NifU-like protein n=1 Tax=Methanomethylovorans hollandica (strain DSM 15978 / NBRC 107637 / DMS1) TaxID=867904 RepID=L0KWA1_METHD|nr:iron-sulfur cluster assembly scaffold protein [Methanomethylovorans hollandica]AGB49406.1 iron-sulfur cluster biosynthesis protein, NifU-like protein [Methanomethylovorans hollandica DSM 15978]